MTAERIDIKCVQSVCRANYPSKQVLGGKRRLVSYTFNQVLFSFKIYLRMLMVEIECKPVLQQSSPEWNHTDVYVVIPIMHSMPLLKSLVPQIHHFN